MTDQTIHEVELEGMRAALLEIIDANPDKVGRIEYTTSNGVATTACIYFHNLRVVAPAADVPTAYAGDKTDPTECEPCCIVGTYLAANPVLLDDPGIRRGVLINDSAADLFGLRDLYGTDSEAYCLSKEARDLLAFAQYKGDGARLDGTRNHYSDIRDAIANWMPSSPEGGD